MDRDRSRLPLKAGRIIERPRLDALLRRGAGCALTTVVAGPGYGKTVAVAAYARTVERRLAWLQLTRYANDTRRFWDVLQSALRPELPGLAAQLEKADFPATAGEGLALARCLAKEVYGGGPVLLVVDDYDNVTDSQLHRFFEGLVELELEGLGIIVITEKNTDLSVTALKTQGGLFAVTDRDLRFNEQEAAAFFAAQGVALNGVAVRDIVEQTEGWPMSLGLLAAQYKREPDDRAALKGSVRSVSGLFYRDHFSAYSQELQGLLVRLAALPGFSMELVRQIGGCDLSAAGRAINESLFIHYENSVGLFVFQKMYREFLAGMLFLLNRAELDRIHLLAGEWYRQNGMLFRSQECFWKCGAYDRFIEGLVVRPRKWLSRELADFALGCLRDLPEAYTRGNHLVQACAAFLHLNNMEVARAERELTALLGEMDPATEDPRGRWLMGEIHAVLGDISLIRNTDAFARHYPEACKYLEDGGSIRGRENGFVGNNSVFFLTGQEAGALERITQVVFDTAPYMERISNGEGYGFEWYFAAEAAFYTGDMEQARQRGYQAIYKAMQQEQHDIVCNIHLLLMRIGLYQGEYAEAKEQMEAVAAYIDDHGLGELADLRESIQSWYCIRLGAADDVAPWVAGRSDQPLHIPINTGRNLLLHPMYLLAKGQYTRTVAFLSQTDGLFREKGLWVLRLTSRVMLAIAHLRLGDRSQALLHLKAAHGMCWQNGIIFPFVEYGNHMRPLVDLARKAENAGDFCPHWLDSVYTKAATFAKRNASLLIAYNRDHRLAPTAAATLTKRELEVLGHAAQGLTREEIAGFLDISVNGVKKHMTTIYNKLGAVNRADAIRIATLRGYI